MIEYDISRWRRLFPAFWSGQALSLFASRLVGFAVIWWLTIQTRAASMLALASLMELLPRAVLASLAGPLVDRWSRRRVLIAADSVVAAATGALALVFWLGVPHPWYLLALLFVRSSADVFHASSMLASVSLMVPASQLARVAGLNQTLEGASLIAAPGLAAVLVSVLPIQLVLAIDGITALLAVLPVALILIPEPAAGGARGKAAPFLEAFREGFAHLAGVKGLLFLFVYGSAAWMLAVPAWRLLPLLATEHLGGGAIQLGMMSSAFGAGIVAGGAILGVWGGFKRRVLTCCTARIGTGVGLLVLGLAPADGFSLALATCAALGATTSLSMGAQRALIQATVPPELQGRIFGIFTAALSVLQPIGFSLFGAFGDLLGPSRVFVIGGASVLALGALMGLTPPLMRMEQVGTAGEGGPQPATAA